MAQKESKPKQSKRQMMREDRKKQARRKRIFTLLAIIGIALVMIGLVIIPTVRTAMDPVGDFIQVTPESIPLAEGMTIGDPDSEVKVVVFEDFKCKACKSFNERIEPLIISNYASNGEVYYEFINYPFLDDNVSIKDSDRAAYASQCAAEQDRFWDYRAILFENLNYQPNEFSKKRLSAFADSLNLDLEEFSECMDDARTRSIINDNVRLAQEMGVTGTPSVFINGVILRPGYVPTYEEISAAIEQAKTESGS